MPGRRLLLAALAAAFCVAFATPSVANAMPCYKRVYQDWASADNKITGHYSPACLRQALKHVPEDLKDYTSIVDDINAALLAALGGPPSKNGSNNGPGSGGSVNPGGKNKPVGGAKPSQKISAAAKRAVPHAGTKASVPGESRRIPLPLILLGAVLAVSGLAAASPALIKQFRTRFPRVRPAPGSVRPPA